MKSKTDWFYIFGFIHLFLHLLNLYMNGLYVEQIFPITRIGGSLKGDMLEQVYEIIKVF